MLMPLGPELSEPATQLALTEVDALAVRLVAQLDRLASQVIEPGLVAEVLATRAQVAALDVSVRMLQQWYA